jgi:hypothetical protein
MSAKKIKQSPPVEVSRDGLIVLEATITSRNGIQLTTAPCPHCGHQHFHGSGGNLKGFQHRLAHCLDGGPPGGYYIRWGGAEEMR